MHIGSIEKLQLTTIGSPLLIRCKIFLFVTFVIPREKECHDIYVTLQRLYQPGSFYKLMHTINVPVIFWTKNLTDCSYFDHTAHVKNLYCFQYNVSNDEQLKSAGWDYFSLETEFKRQHVPNQMWTLCNLNETYGLCETCKCKRKLIGW